MLTGTTNSTSVTGLSSTASLFVGEVVTGANIAPGTSVAAINSGASITLSQASTASGSASLDFGTNLSTLGTIGYNTYSGVTTIAQGTLSITSLANYGSVSGIGTGLAQGNAASLVLGTNATTGILQYIGQNNNSFVTFVESPSVVTNRLFTLAGNGGLDSSGGYGGAGVNTGTSNNAAIWFNNTAPIVFSTGGSKTFTLQGTSTGDNEIDLQLINNTIDGSPLSVTKAGAGTWILGNTNNTYSGVTTITAGALRAQDAGENATSAITTAATASSNVVTLATILAGSNTQTTAGLSIGQSVTGPGIAAGTVITSILSGTQIQLSTTPLSVASGASLTFGSINSLSPNSNLVLNGGVLESTGVFTRSLGSGADQVEWLSATASGGFAASSGSLIVAIGGLNSLTPLVFGTASFTTGTFMLGSASALADTTVLNPIDLNGATRAISVTDNPTAGTDIYNLAGVISGRTGSGLNISNGSSLLTISGANTYSGNTTLTGNISVTSIGSGGSTSAFGDATGQLYLGTGTTATAYLLYTGPGETTTRTINLNTTTGGNTIDSSGSGALVLNSIVNLSPGAKTLGLRGSSTDANTINSVLTDDGGALSISKSDSGTWILNGANTFTGQVTVNGGYIAIGPTWGVISNSAPNPFGMNTSVGASGAPLFLSNGGLYTLDPTGTTFNSPVELNANATETIGGQYSINLNAGIVLPATNAWNVFNNIGQGGTLTIGGTIQWINTETANRIFQILGTGNTVLNASLPSNNNGFSFTLELDSYGTLTINSSSANTGGFTLAEGTVYINAKTPFGTSASPSTGTLTIAGGTIIADLPLTTANGNSAIVNPVALTNSFGVLAGTNSIEFAGQVTNNGGNRVLTNSLTGGASLLLSNSTVALNLSESTNTARTFILGGAGNTTISGPIWNGYNAGANATAFASAFQDQSTGTLTLTAANLYFGATTLGGGTTILSGAGAFAVNSTTTANTASSGSTTLVLSSAAGLIAGEAVVGVGVPSGTTISSISGNTLTLNQAATVAANATLSYGGSNSIVVDPSATLTLDSTGGNAASNRLGNHPLTLNGGALNFIGNSSGTTEGTAGDSGNLTLGSGQSVITVTNNGGNTILNFAGITQNVGSTLDIESNTTLGTASNQINIGQAVTVGANPTGATTLVVSSTAGLFPGETLSGFGISNNTTISSITNGTTLVLNQAPLVIAAGETIEFGVPLADANFNGTSLPLTSGLLPRITINGNSWATWTAATGLTAFTAYNTAVDISTAAITDTVQVNDSTLNTGIPTATSGTTLPGPKTFTALALTSTANNLDISGGGILTLTSGGILETGAGITDTLSVPRIAVVNASPTVNSTLAVEGIFQIATGATLNVTGSVVTGTGGFTKGLGGTLIFSNTQFFTGGTYTLDAGLTQLNAGTNTLDTNIPLTVNTGATFDLNGNSQWVSTFGSGSGIVPGAGGTVTSSNGPALLVANGSSASSTWAGSIVGNSTNDVLTFARIGGNTLTVESANPYYGATYIYGSTVTLQDNASLLNTSSISLNNATLNLNNEVDLFINNNNRINAAAPITMNASTIALTGLADAYSSATLGALTVQSGANVLSAAVAVTGDYGYADLIFASINHSNPDATVNFTSGNTLGAEGANPRILFTNAAGLNYSATTGMIGAWAIANSDTWAGYNPALGVGAVGTSGYQSYTGGYMSGGTAAVTSTPNGTSALTTYSGGTLAGFAPGNVTNIQAGTYGQNQVIILPAGGASTDYLRFAGLPENDLGFTNPTDVLNLTQGGLMHSNSTTIPSSTIIGSTAIPGVLTTGGTQTTGTTELVVFNTAFTTTTAAFTGATTNALVSGSNILNLTSTTNLFPGMGVTGTGIPAGSAVVSVLGPTQVVISQNATATANAGTYTLSENATGALTAGTVLGSNILTLAATDNVYAGMAITGTGIPAGAYITSVLNPTQVTINYNATAASVDQTYTLTSNMVINSSIANNGLGNLTRLDKSGTGTLTLTGGITALTNGVFLNSGSNAITVPTGFTTFNGETVSGPGVPSGTTIVSGGGTASLVLSNSVTGAGMSVLTFGNSGANFPAQGSFVGNSITISGISTAGIAGLYVGELVSGPNIPAGTTVASVTAATNSITLSAPATGSAPVSANLTFSASENGTVSNTTSITGLTSTTGFSWEKRSPEPIFRRAPRWPRSSVARRSRSPRLRPAALFPRSRT